MRSNVKGPEDWLYCIIQHVLALGAALGWCYSQLKPCTNLTRKVINIVPVAWGAALVDSRQFW